MDSLYTEERSTGIDEEKSREAEELQKSVEKLRKQISEVNELPEHVKKSGARSADELGSSGGIRVKRLDAKS